MNINLIEDNKMVVGRRGQRWPVLIIIQHYISLFRLTAGG